MSAFHDLDDFIAIPRVNQLRLAPDGSRLVATVATPARSRKKYVSALWEIDPHGHGEPRRLTLSAAGESAPRFLPDGTLLFLSKRRADDGEDDSDKDTVALWSLPAAGGDARRIADRPRGFTEGVAATDAGTVVLSTPTPQGAPPVEGDDRVRKARENPPGHRTPHQGPPPP